MSASEIVAAERFRFRFVTRGDKANALVVMAMKSLRLCHPSAGMVLVDANDTPTFRDLAAEIAGEVEAVHVPPDDDAVARAVGRGSRQHLFYWRHSPQVLAALSPSDRFAAYADGDVIFLRPMDLGSLISPLAAGRIAAAVDESTIDYYGRLGTLPSELSKVLPAAGSGGPLLQAGLVFTNPADDGGFYEQFWDLAVAAAGSAHLPDLPFDDMCLVTALLGHGGPLWERLLPLGHENNYITDQIKDPGVFGCVAHFGGHRAKAHILEQRTRLFPAEGTSGGWGTVTASADSQPVLVRGPWHRQTDCGPEGTLSAPMPFALSWPVPIGSKGFDLSAILCGPPDAILFIYVDGGLVDRVTAGDTFVKAGVSWVHAEVVTLVGVAGSNDCHLHLALAFEASGERGGSRVNQDKGNL